MSTKTKKTTKTKATDTAKTRKPRATEPPPASPESLAIDGKPARKKRKELSKRLSALDAVTQVLKGSDPMDAKEMIEAMSAQGLWTSPGGKTPHATLYSAILREITAKGDESRLVKTERARFALNG